jgi:hypothetical protein
MRITRADNRRLTVVDFPWLIGVVAFPCAAVMLGVAIAAIVKDRGPSQIAGPIIGALMFFAGGAVFTKRSEFDFDLVAKTLTWRRRGVFTNIGGVLPLDQIRSATVESESGDGGLTYRVALHTQAGTIPLAESYDGNRAPADRVRAAINDALHLNLDAHQQIETDILELALAGRKIDAIAMARQRYGYDLKQAKDFVEGLSG